MSHSDRIAEMLRLIANFVANRIMLEELVLGIDRHIQKLKDAIDIDK